MEAVAPEPAGRAPMSALNRKGRAAPRNAPRLSLYDRKRAFFAVRVMIASAGLGALFASVIKLFFIQSERSIETFGLFGALAGFVISGSLSFLSISITRFRRRPLWFIFFGVPVLFTLVIALEYAVLFHFIMDPTASLGDFMLPQTIAFSLAMTFVFNFIDAINRLLGNHVLRGLLLGTYHRPVVEERFVLFLDLAGSTSTAERIGDLAFHSFLNDFFCDLAKPTIDLGGDIYKYVGDEAIITWDREAGSSGALEAFFAIGEAIAAREDYYRARYGDLPRFRAGLHFGKVVVGEMGDYKQEIALLGDVMNTTARIQGECRVLGVDLLVSADAARALASGDRALEPRGAVSLRGKGGAIELFSVAGD